MDLSKEEENLENNEVHSVAVTAANTANTVGQDTGIIGASTEAGDANSGVTGNERSLDLPKLQ